MASSESSLTKASTCRPIHNSRFLRDIKCSNRNIAQLKGKKIIDVIGLDTGEFLVATNDSRIRLLDSNMNLLMKYKGHKSNKLPMRADMSQ